MKLNWNSRGVGMGVQTKKTFQGMVWIFATLYKNTLRRRKGMGGDITRQIGSLKLFLETFLVPQRVILERFSFASGNTEGQGETKLTVSSH